MGEVAAVTWVAHSQAAEIEECADYVQPMYRLIDVSAREQSDSQIFSSSWLSDAVVAGPDRYDIGVLTKIVSELESGMRAGNFELIGGLLRKLPYEALSPQVVVTVLRTTFSARAYIPRWTQAREAARQALSRRGLNSERILRGL